MKKLLTTVLMVAIVFTFSFTSAFAVNTAGTHYTADEAKAILAAAHGKAATLVKAVEVNYDTIGKQAHLADPTVFSIDKAHVQKGIDKKYEEALTAIAGDTNSILGQTLTLNTEADINLLADVLVKSADTETYFKAAFDAYKAYLTGLVDKVNLADYTTTTVDPLYTAKDGEKYDTAAKAAAADVAYAKKLIAETTEEGKTEASYKAVYNAVFGQVIKVVENKDDVIYTDEVSSVGYALVGDYATKSSEAAAAATVSAAQAVAKAKLAEAVAKFQNSSDYKAKFAESVAAYVKAQTYIIENHKGATNAATIAELAAMDFTINTQNTDAEKVNGATYIKRVADAEAADKRAEFLKADKDMNGKDIYDGAKIDENIAKAKYNLYKDGTAITDSMIIKDAINYLQNSEKITLKDEADGVAGTDKENHVFTVDQPNAKDLLNSINGKKYYAKEWDAIKAALETYKAAVDAAKTSSDVDEAKEALKKAVAKLSNQDAVDANMTLPGKLDDVADAVSKYHASKAAAAGDTIYVTWDGKEYDAAFVADHLRMWYIEKGARSANEAKALYAEACKVIDAYKTKDALKAEAAKVVEQIKALPTTVTLADKAAVVAAKEAFDALPPTIQGYVTNVKTLNDDIAAVEKAEGYDVAKLVNALPTVSKVTPADKEAVLAAKKAANAYKDSFKTTYKGVTPTYAAGQDGTVQTKIKDLMNAIKKAELDAINNAVKLLSHKYHINGKLTEEDLPAVKAAQALIDQFGKDYPADAIKAAPAEKELSQMTGKVMDLAKEGEIKAVEGIQLKARSVAKKGYIKVTWRFVNGEAKDAQYFEVYRSTKRNSGFKKVFTTKDNTKLTYKNTKGLKKGVTYYYKVRAVKVVDGKKLTSDWSNKAYRAAK